VSLYFVSLYFRPQAIALPSGTGASAVVAAAAAPALENAGQLLLVDELEGDAHQAVEPMLAWPKLSDVSSLEASPHLSPWLGLIWSEMRGLITNSY
jgi:hypothetical protein